MGLWGMQSALLLLRYWERLPHIHFSAMLILMLMVVDTADVMLRLATTVRCCAPVRALTLSLSYPRSAVRPARVHPEKVRVVLPLSGARA